MKKYVCSSTTSEIKYEIEVTRKNVTPREFYNYCNSRFKTKTGDNLDMWVSYDYWIDESHRYYHKDQHADWDTPQVEVLKEYPYEVQYYVANTYNFILEFEFTDDRVGTGYMYVKEYVR